MRLAQLFLKNVRMAALPPTTDEDADRQGLGPPGVAIGVSGTAVSYCGAVPVPYGAFLRPSWPRVQRSCRHRTGAPLAIRLLAWRLLPHHSFPFFSFPVLLLHEIGRLYGLSTGKMGYTMEKVPWHEGWIAMMLYIAIEERERERAIGSPSPPPGSPGRLYGLSTGQKQIPTSSLALASFPVFSGFHFSVARQLAARRGPHISLPDRQCSENPLRKKKIYSSAID